MTTPSLGAFDRGNRIGGTDAKRIMAGDWLALWQEKKGIIPPADLSHVFKVQLGKHTERFHVDWFFKMNPTFGKRADEILMPHAVKPYMAATIDAMVDDTVELVPLEVKHSYDRPVRDCANSYAAQLQHQLFVTGAPYLYFSMIGGNVEPSPVKVARNEEYIAQMVELCDAFWWHVTENVEPGDTNVIATEFSEVMATATAAIPTIMIAGKRDYDMGLNNAWVSSAADYLRLKDDAATFETAKKALKDLVPADGAKVYGAGITIERNAKGAMLFK